MLGTVREVAVVNCSCLKLASVQGQSKSIEDKMREWKTLTQKQKIKVMDREKEGESKKKKIKNKN